VFLTLLGDDPCDKEDSQQNGRNDRLSRLACSRAVPKLGIDQSRVRKREAAKLGDLIEGCGNDGCIH